MTPEQLAELFVEDTGDNITGIATDIEILLKQAYKSGYKCAVDKTEEWLDDNLSELVRDQEMIGTICRYMHKKDNIEQFRKAMQLL